MTSDRGAGRYAPTPSGDLHIGNLRTAVAAWLAAAATDRGFAVRVDDLDEERCDEETATRQLEDLACLLYTSPSPRDQRGSRMPSSA